MTVSHRVMHTAMMPSPAQAEQQVVYGAVGYLRMPCDPAHDDGRIGSWVSRCPGCASSCLASRHSSRTWAVLMLLARRLPPGLMKDLAGILPTCATTMWRLRHDPDVPLRAKAALLIAGLWVLSPIDLIPEFLPVVGPLDDIVVVALALRYAARPGSAQHPRRSMGGRTRDS